MMKSDKFKVLLSIKHPRSRTINEVLGKHFEVVEKSLSQDQLARKMKKEYDAIIVSIWTPITKNMITSASSKIKTIATLSVGFDHIDRNAAEGRGIRVINAAFGDICASTYTVAEHAFGLLLYLVRNICLNERAFREGRAPWNNLSQGIDSRILGEELFNRTLGIIGVGRIGSHVARIGKGFRMEVIGYDPYVNKEKALEDGANLVDSLDKLLSKSDFISLNPCLTNETERMINRSRISEMNNGVYMVNTARGELVDEDALLGGLEDEQIAGYATDVLWGDPPSEETSPLLVAYRKNKFQNLLITPHVAGFTHQSEERYAIIVANRVKEALTGKTYTNSTDYLKL